MTVNLAVPLERVWPVAHADQEFCRVEDVAALETEFARVVAERDRLSALILQCRCIACGEVFAKPSNEDEADALKLAHIQECPKHPIATLRAQVEALRALWCYMDACSENVPNDVPAAAMRMVQLEEAARACGALEVPDE